MDAVLRGKKTNLVPQFSFSTRDSFQTEETPAGPVEILYLAEREDFVHCLRALAYRCELRDIPASVGANTIQGLINWEKISRHKMAYLASGGRDWADEFRRFTAEKANYCDTLILLSAGPYSAVPAEKAGFDPTVWEELSFQIRRYHELTHFVCRRLFPGQIDVIRDEIMADMIGLLAATGKYDKDLARLFLGLEDSGFRPGGRLAYYATPEEMETAAARAAGLVDWLAEQSLPVDNGSVFDTLLALY